LEDEGMLNSRTAGVLGAALALLLCAAGARADFLLATPVAPPGWNPEYNGGVLLYDFVGTGPLRTLPTIPGRPQTLLNDPIAAIFDTSGELFVANRHGNVGGGVGSIARFEIDALGNYVPNGSITGNGLDAVHGLAFGPSGELFAANFRSDTISRFTFDANGAAIPNGIITLDGSDYVLGLAFSPAGELFANDYGKITRFLFDDTGAPVPNGSFTVPVDNAGLLSFSPAGELFIASHDNDTVLRYLFDDTGHPVSNGSIPVRGPIGFAFSPVGELFVSSHGFFSPSYDPGFGQISRFLFDSDGNAIANGSIVTPSLGQPAITVVPEPPSLALVIGGVLGLLGASWMSRPRAESVAMARMPWASRVGERVAPFAAPAQERQGTLHGSRPRSR
jgi:hypothetical protein